jgi:hypothetical protein
MCLSLASQNSSAKTFSGYLENKIIFFISKGNLSAFPGFLYIEH